MRAAIAEAPPAFRGYGNQFPGMASSSGSKNLSLMGVVALVNIWVTMARISAVSSAVADFDKIMPQLRSGIAIQ